MEPTVLVRDELSKTVAAAADSRGFQIIRLLSDSGGMADVYEAFQVSVRRRVAAKRLKPHLVNEREIVDRFREEGEKLGQLSHPNILQVIDYHDETLTLFLEFIDGHSYDEILTSEGFPSREKAIEIICEILDGLAFAHKRRIVHRDIKPGNIFVTNDGRVKIADFGIAKILGGDDAHKAESGWVGSPSYISPEQVLRGRIDGRADIYSTGIMLYLLVTHRLPFFGKTPQELASHHLNDLPTPPIQIDPTIGAELNGIILRALEKNADTRFQSAREFRDALQKLIAPRQDEVYLEQARTELDQATRCRWFQRKSHLDNARKLTELAREANPESGEAQSILGQVQRAAAQHRKQGLILSVIGGGGLLACAAAAAHLFVKAPGTLDVVVTDEPIEVLLDGERIGTASGAASGRFTVKAGKHRLSYSIPGVIDFPKGGKEIIIQENKVLEETPTVPNIGKVLVVSPSHPGARIQVDGVMQSAQVPAKLTLLYGEHTIVINGVEKRIQVGQGAMTVEF